MHDRLFPSDIPDLPPANPDPLEALQAAAVAFVERIEGHLEEDCREGELDDHVPPSGAANDTCTRLAREIASIVAAAPRMKSAAFSEEPGGVSLVLQSLASKRRTNFRISADGWPIEATHVDEHMRVGTRRISANDVLAVRELTEWLTQ